MQLLRTRSAKALESHARQRPRTRSLRSGRCVVMAVLVCLGATASPALCSRVSVIVDSSLRSALQPSLDLYINDLAHYGWKASLWEYDGGGAESIRTHLQSEYSSPGGLAGAVFVGNLPGASYSYGGNTFASDLYYMDVDGSWSDSNLDGVLDSHAAGNGSVAPEVWVGRLSPNFSEGDVGALTSYFTRHHLYAKGLMQFNKSALLYVDDDWWAYGNSWQKDMSGSGWTVEMVNSTTLTGEADYEARLDEGNYHWLRVAAHSDENAHYWTSDWESAGETQASEISGLNPQVGFYDLFACEATNYEQADYLAGKYVFGTDYGLAAVGSTSPGGLTQLGTFYQALHSKECVGQALLDWFDQQAADGFSDYETSMYYGLTIVGDPTLAPMQSHHMPEPSTFALVALGLPAFWWWRRKQEPRGLSEVAPSDRPGSGT